MNKTQLFDFMDKVTDVMVAAAPFASAMGVPFVERVAGIANAAVDAGLEFLAQAEEAKIILTSTDKVEIADKIAALEIKAVELNAYVINS